MLSVLLRKLRVSCLVPALLMTTSPSQTSVTPSQPVASTTAADQGQQEKADSQEKARDSGENADFQEKAPDSRENADSKEKVPDSLENADSKEKADQSMPAAVQPDSLAFVDTLPDNHEGQIAQPKQPQPALLALPSYDPGKEDAQDPNEFLRKDLEAPLEAHSCKQPLQALPSTPQELPLNRQLFPEEDDDDDTAFGDLDALLAEYPMPESEDSVTVAVLEAAVSDDEDAEDWAAVQDRSSTCLHKSC